MYGMTHIGGVWVMVPRNWSSTFSISSLVTPSKACVERTGPSESYVVVAAPSIPQLSYSYTVSCSADVSMSRGLLASQVGRGETHLCAL